MANKLNLSMSAILGMIGLLLALYLVLLIPFPAFIQLRSQINYWIVLLLFILLELMIALFIFKIIIIAKKGYIGFKQKLLRADFKIQQWIMSR